MGLQQEIKQTRTFGSPQEEAILSILKTADVLRRRIIRVLEPTGLSQEQYNVLRILRGAGETGLPTLEVASRMIEQTPAITRLMDKLEVKKFVRRVRCKEDRRQVLCYITPSALELINLLDHPIREAGRKSFPLQSGEISQLLDSLSKIRESQDEELPSTSQKKS